MLALKKVKDVSELDDNQFIEILSQAISALIEGISEHSGVTGKTSSAECKDFGDAYSVGQIHALTSVMSLISLASFCENFDGNDKEFAERIKILQAEAESLSETKQ